MNLSDQDRPLHDDVGWVPADEHERKSGGRANNISLNRDGDDEYEDITDDESHARHHSRRSMDDDRMGSLKNGTAETRGRREGEGLITQD